MTDGVAVGEYELYLESFDALSGIKPTLKSDKIVIEIVESQ